MDLTGCPDKSCHAVAEITRRFVMESTDGPIEHAHTQCLKGHWYMLPTALLRSQGS